MTESSTATAAAPAATAVPPERPVWNRASILRALGNPLRFQMLEAIVHGREGFNIQEMADHVGMKRSVVGKHLRLLRGTRVVVLDAEAANGREQVHVIHPALRPPEGAPLVFDFGFMVLRFAGTAPAAGGDVSAAAG